MTTPIVANGTGQAAETVAGRAAGKDSAGGLVPLAGQGIHLGTLVQAKGPDAAAAAQEMGQFVSAVSRAPAVAPAQPGEEQAPDRTYAPGPSFAPGR